MNARTPILKIAIGICFDTELSGEKVFFIFRVAQTERNFESFSNVVVQLTEYRLALCFLRLINILSKIIAQSIDLLWCRAVK